MQAGLAGGILRKSDGGDGPARRAPGNFPLHACGIDAGAALHGRQAGAASRCRRAALQGERQKIGILGRSST